MTIQSVRDCRMSEESTSSVCIETIYDNTSSKECEEGDNNEHIERNGENN